MSIPGSAEPLLLAQQDTGGYQIQRSLRFNSSDSAFLSRTPASAGNRKTWTWAGWVKRSGLGTEQTLFMAGTVGIDGGIWFRSDNRIECYSYNGSYTYQKQTAQLFRDTSAWYHIVHVLDTDNATAEDRVRLYVNGVRVTDWSSSSNPTQGTSDGIINTTYAHIISSLYGGARYFSGYLADIHFIDGQALDPSSFVETSATTGQLIPKAYTGTFTGNSFWLKFADNSAATATTLGKDSSGLGNNWTPNNLSVTAGAGNDSLVDTPTSVSATDTGIGGEIRGNYATLNPIGTVKPATGVIPTLTNGSLDATHSGGSWQYANSTIAVPAGSGKYYCEFYISSSYAPDYIAVGVNPATASNFSATVHSSSQSGVFYSNNGEKWVTGSNSAYGSAYTTGDLIGVALNCDSGQITFYKNNTSQGAISFNSNLTNGGTIYFTIDIHTSNLVANFGQRSWAYAAPAGFKALCDTNLPAPVVAKPSTVMDVKLWTGNGSSQTISGLGFSPDLVWIKARSQGIDWHALFNTVVGATTRLFSNSTSTEATNTQTLTAFNSDGFSVGNTNEVNGSSTTYVGWCWDAGSTTVTDNTGSIQSTRRTNASAGFSVITFNTQASGTATVGHGLGVAPEMFIIKARTVANNWWVYHKALPTPQSNAIALNLTSGALGSTTLWNNTAPTSNVLNFDSGWAGNNPVVVYAWAPVAGYSSFGRYEGNGSADGPFVYTGFRPKFILIKPLYDYDGGGSTVASTSWYMYDSARGPYNGNGAILAANKTYAEENNATDIDFLSNGFKLRNTRAVNAQGTIYAAWAESPFQYSRAR